MTAARGRPPPAPAQGRASNHADLAPNSVHNYYVLLNKTFRYALRHRLIPFNPADGVELPKNVRSEGFAPVLLTAKQVEALVAEMSALLDTLVRFAAHTGLRAAEIAGLRVRDLNLRRDTSRSGRP